MSDIASVMNAFLAAMEDINSTPYDLDQLRKRCLDAESVMRNLFAVDRQNPLLGNPYLGLVDVFDLPLESRLARPRNWQRNNFPWRSDDAVYYFPEEYLLPVPRHLQRSRGTASTVDTLSSFLEAWNIFSGGALAAIKNWDNIVVAGGSVLACVTAALSNQSCSRSRAELFRKYQAFPYKSADIDLFLWGMTEEQAKRKMEEIFNVIDSSARCGAICFRNKNTITIQTEFPRRPIQIIMRLYQSPAEILCGFDIDCCCFAFNGTNVFTNPRGLTAIVRQCNTIDVSRRSPSYEHRLAKYADRGYEIFYPSLERDRIDYPKLSDPDRTTFPKGLARLIVYEIMDCNYRSFPELYEKLVDYDPPSLEDLRPSNYDYRWCKIPYGPKWWDPKKVMKHVKERTKEIIQAISADFNPSLHYHVVTFGGMRECLERCCDEILPEVPLPEDAPSALFRGPAQFMITNPGRQVVGSFNPITSDDWEEAAYRDDRQSTHGSVH